MAEPPKSRVQQLFQGGFKSTKNYLSEHVDARAIVEQAQRNVRDLARKAEQRFQEATGRKEQQDVSILSGYFLLKKRINIFSNIFFFINVLFLF
jgi:hypothetical protein